MEHTLSLFDSISTEQSPSRSKTHPRRPAATGHSPILPPRSTSALFSQSPSANLHSSPSLAATPASSQHPLAQPPITASGSTSNQNSPAPLPFLPLASAQISSLKAGLIRRRSSYPPATTPGSSSAGNLFPWAMGGTPGANGFDWGAALDAFPGFGIELGPGSNLAGASQSGSGLTPGNVGWDTLLSFENEAKNPSPLKMVSSNLATAKPIITSPETTPKESLPSVPRAKSDPPSHHHVFSNLPNTGGQDSIEAPTPTGSSSSPATILQPPSQLPPRVVQFGADLAWRTALASVVEVEGVGQVTVASVLQEIWRRGGGELVTSQCLWPSIVIALAMPSAGGPNARVPNPSAESSMALQSLYNLSIRHWEPVIFTGLLGAYASSAAPDAPVDQSQPAPINAFAPTPHYGPSTPLREPDVSQWMNLTPSGWSFLANGGNGGVDEAKPQVNAESHTGFPFPLNPDLEMAGANRRTSLTRTDAGDDSHIKGIDEILASMEEGNEEQERAVIAANLASSVQAITPQPHGQNQNNANLVSDNHGSTFQFPTPETDSSQSPPDRRSSKHNVMSPVSMASPYVSAGSSTVLAPTPASSTSTAVSHSAPVDGSSSSLPKPPNKARPSQLSMPPVEFIPPPPMCMFFNPSFENLTDGKAGIWRGDLEVRGRGGGKFPIIVVGEKDTEHLWQSQLWPQTLTYPLTHLPADSSCTSTMIPVSHLAREGLIPITMGMVLCNEPPERIAPYVNLVQGLHAEGVGFHLPCETRLPIVFLPAKFHSSDPLLRLGIAFMGKAGYPHPAAPMPSNKTTSNNGQGRGRSVNSIEEEGPKKKKRRQSAPAGVSPAVPSGRGGNKRKESAGVPKIMEEAE
ncbi:hypothetical protein I317_07498 [Kwoniella heveanensis CBS 569]|nr:hypothetical protein I317_07498 [Kwoniella heveanensis CBS 569]